MRSRTAALVLVALIAFLALAILLAPTDAQAQRWQTRGLAEPILAVVQDRIYRAGVFLVVDALVENTSRGKVEGVEVSVEFYNFFAELVRLEHTLLTPATLGPDQVAALRVVTPHSDSVRKLHYRFTWRRDNEQLQAVSKRDVWTIGAAFGALVTDEKSPIYRYAKRAFFILDRQGRVRWMRVQANPLDLLAPEDILKALKESGA